MRSAVWPSTVSSTSSDGGRAIDAGCLIALALRIYSYILLARLLLSWFPNPPDGLRPVYKILYDLTEPVLRMVRPLIPPIRMGAGAFDISPILIFILLSIFQGVLC